MQLTLGASVSIPPNGKEKCVFCKKDHQKEKKKNKQTQAYMNSKNVDNLIKAGRPYITDERGLTFYPGKDEPPLVKWDKVNINETKGYKAAGHHSLATSVVAEHDMSGELKAIGYDPDRGSNCIMLPYDNVQFSRARALGSPMQKHSGGHAQTYFDAVEERLDEVARQIKKRFCAKKKSGDDGSVLELMLVQENFVFSAIANSVTPEFYIHDDAYLEPSLMKIKWGKHAKEVGYTKTRYLKEK